jgi:predicted phosphodiesterase
VFREEDVEYVWICVDVTTLQFENRWPTMIEELVGVAGKGDDQVELVAKVNHGAVAL